MLPKLSKEQEDIIIKILNGNNIIVDSVAGSGKTTTSLQIAIHTSPKQILLLTYNSRLKSETRGKVFNLTQNGVPILMEVHSYHSFNVKYYNKSNYTDIGIVQTLTKNLKIQPNKLTNKKVQYDILILDEAQDITETFFKFICKIFVDTCTNNTQICILGDKNQSIFDFNNADNRYLTFADKIFNFNDKLWTTANLSTSYRITNQMANYLNKNMLSYNRLNAIKNGRLPKYMIIDVYNDHLSIYRQIDNIIKNGYTYSDIFILAPSVKSETTPIKALANYLSITKDINIYVSSDDSEAIDEELVKNKLVITTFHQIKGLERKIVFVTSFDNSYFDYYKRNTSIDKSNCPNEMYVSCTRAIDILIVVHHKHKQKLEFLNMENLIENTNIYYYCIDNRYDKILSNTKLSHIDAIFDVDLNCADYLPKKIAKLFENLSSINLIKYTLLPKMEKAPNNIKKVYDNIIAYINGLFKIGYQLNEILVITTEKESMIITPLYESLSKTIDGVEVTYTKNIQNIDLIKVILYYDFSANRTNITLTDIYYTKHATQLNNKISSFKIPFGSTLLHDDLKLL